MKPAARWGTTSLLAGLLWIAPEAGLSSAYPLREIELGQPARPFSLADGQGKAQSLSAYAGKPVFLGYSRAGQSFSDKAMAAWSRLHKRFSSKGVVFLGLWHKDADAPGAAPGPAPFPLMEDGQRAVYGSYGLFILPTSVVLDREHRVRAAVGGYSDGLEDELESALNDILGIKAAKAAPRHGLPGEIQDPAVNQARLLLKDGRAEQALAALGSADARQPCPARLVMAEALLSLGRAAEAKARLADCLAEPTPQTATLMGRALALLGDAAGAETWLKKAVASSPDPQRARFYLGELYEKAGRKDEALAQYRAGLERALAR